MRLMVEELQKQQETEAMVHELRKQQGSDAMGYVDSTGVEKTTRHASKGLDGARAD